MPESVAFTIGIVLILVYLLLLVYSVFAYIFQSLGLHTLARRRGIASPWLAWIPFGNYWIIGSLARDYDKQNNIHRRWDKVLFILSIVCVTSFVVIYIALFVFVIINAVSIDSLDTDVGEALALEILSGILIFYVVLVIIMIAMIALQALMYVCLYKIFESTVPEKALKYFLIYLLVPFAAPFCLFACRNKGYQHHDPLAYIYSPVNKDYSYYRPLATEQMPTQPQTENSAGTTGQAEQQNNEK